MHIELNAVHIAIDLFGKSKGAPLETFMKDRKTAAGPYQKFHLVPPPIQKHKDVAVERVLRQYMPHLIRKAIKGFSETHGLHHHKYPHGSGE